jgi:hypothetical protein
MWCEANTLALSARIGTQCCNNVNRRREECKSSFSRVSLTFGDHGASLSGGKKAAAGFFYAERRAGRFFSDAGLESPPVLGSVFAVRLLRTPPFGYSQDSRLVLRFDASCFQSAVR